LYSLFDEINKYSSTPIKKNIVWITNTVDN